MSREIGNRSHYRISTKKGIDSRGEDDKVLRATIVIFSSFSWRIA